MCFKINVQSVRNIVLDISSTDFPDRDSRVHADDNVATVHI